MRLCIRSTASGLRSCTSNAYFLEEHNMIKGEVTLNNPEIFSDVGEFTEEKAKKALYNSS